jgi:hypothetical protein
MAPRGANFLTAKLLMAIVNVLNAKGKDASIDAEAKRPC